MSGAMRRLADWTEAILLLWLAGASTAGLCADEITGRTAAHRAIVGWDDSVICCGPGTVAGMDSPEAVRQMVRRWKARGYAGVYWRVDEFMLPERFVVRHSAKRAPATNYLLARMENVLREFPVLKTLQEACDREGVELWARYPTIYSSGALRRRQTHGHRRGG